MFSRRDFFFLLFGFPALRLLRVLGLRPSWGGHYEIDRGHAALHAK